ncbi:MAG: N-sulfoglucosamine sulfohydrolase [Planctomycetota bacterium]|jgi:N-sulfoglucosamine sulfohydrolase
MKQLRAIWFLSLSLALLVRGYAQKPADALPTDSSRPNVLWIYVEDTNDWMSCYGDTLIQTPNIDALAARGTRFTRMYMPAGVCSPTRSAIITGMHQTSIGAHQHYSSVEVWRGIESDVWDPNYLGVRTIPEILHLARYYTFNKGKLHYNFVYDIDRLYDSQVGKMNFQGAKGGACWNGRGEGQPFFGQIQMTGGKTRTKPVVDRSAVFVPPYYPDHPAIREAIGHHYDTILDLDREVGDIVAALKRDGLFENTVIVFFTDHGMSLMRHKQFLYEGGIRVPCIIAGPGIPKGVVRDDIVSGIDLSATTLSLAGVSVPPHMQGRDIFADDYHRDHFVAARDRCDYTIDRIRAVVTERYKYLRNFMTDRPYLQPQYRDARPEMKAIKELQAAGKLNAVQSAFAGPLRPAEELYDLEADPHETHNLVHDPEHAQVLAEMRQRLQTWILETDDQGRFPESDEALRAALKRWGDKAVNSEYDRVR